MWALEGRQSALRVGLGLDPQEQALIKKLKCAVEVARKGGFAPLPKDVREKMVGRYDKIQAEAEEWFKEDEAYRAASQSPSKESGGEKEKV